MSKIRPISFIIFLLLILFFKVSVADFYRVGSNSMRSTIVKGDNILINMLAYNFRTPNIVTIPIINYSFSIPSINIKHSNIEIGDIIVFRLKGFNKPFIKRCVAISGDRVMFDNKRLFVNGEENPLIEKHIELLDSTTFSPMYNDPNIYPNGNGNRDYYKEVIVPQNSIFVSGDNRDFSLDSRYIGFIDRKNVVGKAVLIYYSDVSGRSLKLIR